MNGFPVQWIERLREGDALKIRERNVVVALGQSIARRIGEARYQLWFARHTRFRLEEGCLTVGVPNRHFEEWLQKKFGEAVKEGAFEVLQKSPTIRFVIDPELFQASRKDQEAVREEHSKGSVAGDEPAAEQSPGKRHQPKSGKKTGKAKPESSTARSAQKSPFTEASKPKGNTRNRRWRHLNEFVIGSCNRVAHAAALSVVEDPGDGANPLVLFGPVGTGKTHLLEGIYAGLRKTRPNWRICFVTAEDFTNRFVQAMRLGKIGSFRNFFRDADVLILDDLHFLAAKKATQEEFLHTFDELFAEGRQIVVACDCHPRLADDFTPELTDRLLGGVAWALAPADQETRLAILRAKAGATRGTPPSEAVLKFLAQQLRGNVRELEGALQSVRHYAQVTDRVLDVDLVREALADLLRHAVRVVQLADIDKAVRTALRLDGGALQAKGRAWGVSHPRMVAMYLARKHTAAAYSAIGSHFGGKNHSTAVAAEKKVRQWLTANAELAFGDRQIRICELVERIERDLLR